MNKFGTKTTVMVGVLSVVLCFGCQKSAAPSETMAALEREVARLRAEKANLDARSSALDDKVLVLEKRLEKCDTSAGKGLAVVKLRPGETETAEEEPVTYETIRDDAKRPRLVLDDAALRRSGGRQVRHVAPKEPVSRSTDFSGLGADNLGVVGIGAPADGSADVEASQSAMDGFNAAYRDYSNKRYEAALHGFAAFVNAHPTHDYADNAIYWRGECYLTKGQLTHAIGEFQRLTRRYPHSEKVAASVYRIGFIYDKLRDYGKAADYYFKVVERYPGTDEARRASRRVAEIRNRGGNVGLMPTSATR